MTSIRRPAFHTAQAAIVAAVATALFFIVSSARGQQARTRPVESRDTWFADGQAALAEALRLQATGLRARNVILFVGDGMGISTVTAARILEGQMKGGSGEENRLSFETLPWLALSKTYSANQQVSDSAPTMTAMMTGVKTNDAILSLDQGAVHDQPGTARGHELATLLEMAEDAGLATGIVTTARLTHATPAATYAHTVDRDWEDDANLPADVRGHYPDIAAQFLDFNHGDGIEVALGGGRAQFLPETAVDPEYPTRRGRRLDGRDLTVLWRAKHPDGAYVWNANGFRAVDPAKTHRLLGLFEPSHMQYEHDRPRDAAGEPSLTEMTAKALDILSRGPRGYFLMVEAGRIDHGHHEGNAYRALTDAIELSNAVRLARARTRDDETLIVVTADHSHTLTLAGMAARGNPILGLVRENAKDGTTDPAASIDLLGKPYTTLGYRNGPGFTGASQAQPEGPKRFPHAPTVVAEAQKGRPGLAFVDTADPDYLQEATMPLGNETHAGEDVAIFAGGPAAHLFHGVREQHYIFHVMAYALGLSPHGRQPTNSTAAR